MRTAKYLVRTGLVAVLAGSACAPVPAVPGVPPVTVSVREEPGEALGAAAEGNVPGSAENAIPPGTVSRSAAQAPAVPGQLVVTTASGIAPDLAGAGLAGASILAGVPLGGRTTWLVQLPGENADLQGASADLLRTGTVEAAAPNHVVEPFETPPTNDPLLPSQWPYGSDVSDVYGAWAVWDTLAAERRDDSTVAVIDWFPQRSHFDLNLLTGYWSAPALVAGTDISTSFDRSQDVDHGLKVSGVVGAIKDNNLGAAGVAPGVPVLPIRVTDSNGSATDFNIIQSLQIAAYFDRADSPYTNTDNASAGPVRVVNMSLGASMTYYAPIYDAAMQFCRDRGILVLVAAGNNNGDGRVESPANSPFATAVSASMQYLGFELLAPYSSRGDEIWVAGPGNMIWATSRDNGYSQFNGTSSATPFVAGVAALINAKYGSGGADQATATWTARVKQRLADTATDLGPPGFDTGYGHGRVHALRAISGTMP